MKLTNRKSGILIAFMLFAFLAIGQNLPKVEKPKGAKKKTLDFSVYDPVWKSNKLADNPLKGEISGEWYVLGDSVFILVKPRSSQFNNYVSLRKDEIIKKEFLKPKEYKDKKWYYDWIITGNDTICSSMGSAAMFGHKEFVGLSISEVRWRKSPKYFKLQQDSIKRAKTIQDSISYASTIAKIEKDKEARIQERLKLQYERAGVTYNDLNPTAPQRGSIKTVTEQSDDGLAVRKYSYYLDSSGNKVRHGAYSLTYSSTNSRQQGRMIIKANFKDGKLHGQFKYYDNRIWYTNIFGTWVMDNELDKHKKPTDVTVNCYNGFATGNIDFNYVGYDYLGSATNGVLDYNTTFNLSLTNEYAHYDYVVIKNYINPSEGPSQKYLVISSFDDQTKLDSLGSFWLTDSGEVIFKFYVVGFDDFISFKLPAYPVKLLDKQ
ncbi:MAG: hypothetical protein PHR79_07335 [Bacteroidales bacterium]|nr:hypothetical protein [Bacteroidales bacterium]